MTKENQNTQSKKGTYTAREMYQRRLKAHKSLERRIAKNRKVSSNDILSL